MMEKKPVEDAEIPRDESMQEALAKLPPEVGGAKGPEPTRYGDWSHKGRCTDF